MRKGLSIRKSSLAQPKKPLNTIIMLHGLPASGKSFVANAIRSAIPNSTIVKSVNLRPVRGFGAGLFDENNPTTREDKDKSYRALCSEAEKILKRDNIPVLDATFHKQYRRGWVHDISERMNAKLIIISVSCSEQTARNRIQNRHTQDNEDAFLKSVDAYELMKTQSDTLTEKDTVKHFDSDTGKMEELVEWLKNTLL